MKKLYYMQLAYGGADDVRLIERDVLAETEFHWTVSNETAEGVFVVSKRCPLGWAESKAAALQDRLRVLDCNIKSSQARTENMIDTKRRVEELQKATLDG